MVEEQGLLTVNEVFIGVYDQLRDELEGIKVWESLGLFTATLENKFFVFQVVRPICWGQPVQIHAPDRGGDVDGFLSNDDKLERILAYGNITGLLDEYRIDAYNRFKEKVHEKSGSGDISKIINMRRGKHFTARDCYNVEGGIREVLFTPWYGSSWPGGSLARKKEIAIINGRLYVGEVFLDYDSNKHENSTWSFTGRRVNEFGREDQKYGRPAIPYLVGMIKQDLLIGAPQLTQKDLKEMAKAYQDYRGGFSYTLPTITK